ncbi:MAG: very short patch repair endonuclease [Planctomycetes bacterium]|nr:very short patch repair endonuclease [Planctomycetota bacterium]
MCIRSNRATHRRLWLDPGNRRPRHVEPPLQGQHARACTSLPPVEHGRVARRTTARTRSEQMARIKGRNTAPELLLRRLLWRRGVRYRLHYRTSAGRPDLAFVGARIAVFIDGCFWHGCPEHYVPPRSSTEFWSTKLRGNVERDQRQTARLEAEGWTVLRFWEHEVFEEPERVALEIHGVVTTGELRRPTAQPRVVRVESLDPCGNVERRYLRSLRDDRDLGSEVRERRTGKWKRRRPPD